MTFKAQAMLFRARALTTEDRRDAATRARWADGVKTASCVKGSPQTAILTVTTTATTIEDAEAIIRDAARSTGLAFDSVRAWEAKR